MIVNTIIIILVCNNLVISEYDKFLWKTKLILILIGICFGCFFLSYKFLKFLTINKLFLIFLITRVLFLYFLTIFNYGAEIDFGHFPIIVQRILNGELFTPYSSDLIPDYWRIIPPMWLWWYTYNYLIYGLDLILWRIINLLLEVGIVYVMIQIFHENPITKTGQKEENFKIGLSFYIFSIFPLVGILLYANIIALPVLMGLLGFLLLFRSKKNPKNLYYAVVFFCLSALVEFFAAIWILGILFIVLIQKNFRRLIILIGAILAVFCLVCLPFLINDAWGFLERLLSHFKLFASNWDGTIWAINWTLFNWPEIISYIPAGIAVILSLYCLYKNYRSEISLDFFIVIISIFLFFSVSFSPWHYLWIFPLICLNLYSFRKFFIINLFFIGFFFFWVLWFATAFVTYPGPVFADYWATYIQIIHFYMSPLGYFAILPLLVQPIFQMGFVYLIYSYTKSKTLVLGLLIPFIIYYIFNICYPANVFY